MSKTITVDVFVKNAVASLDGEVVATKPIAMTVEKFIEYLKEEHKNYKINVQTLIEPILNDNEKVDRTTGEVTKIKSNLFSNILDRHSRACVNKEVTAEQLEQLRSLSAMYIGTVSFIGIATALVVGKTILTGTAIGLGTTLLIDIITRKKRISIFKAKLKR